MSCGGHGLHAFVCCDVESVFGAQSGNISQLLEPVPPTPEMDNPVLEAQVQAVQAVQEQVCAMLVGGHCCGGSKLTPLPFFLVERRTRAQECPPPMRK